MLKELIALIIVVFAFVALFLICFVAGGLLGRFEFEGQTSLVAVATVAVAFVGSVISFVFARRKLGLPKFSRSALAVVFSLLVVTWAVGVPQVHSDLTKSEVAEYKRLKVEDNRVWEAHPYIRFFVSVPIAPGLILTYHEYQLAGLYGAGTWEVHVWYVVGTRSLFGVGTWIS